MKIIKTLKCANAHTGIEEYKTLTDKLQKENIKLMKMVIGLQDELIDLLELKDQPSPIKLVYKKANPAI